MNNKQLIMNVAVILLLLAAGIGIYTTPRFNYAELLARQSSIEHKFTKMADTSEVAIGRAENAISTAIDIVTTVSRDSEQSSRLLSELVVRVRATEERLEALESQSSLDIERPASGLEALKVAQQLTDKVLEAWSTPIELPPELQKPTDGWHAYALQELEFDKFLSRLIEGRILPYASSEAVPNAVKEDLKALQGIFKTSMSILDAKKALRINELVEIANSSGNYIEVALDATPEEIDAKMKGVRPGLKQQRNYNELGVRRIYVFPHDEYPDWGDFQDASNNMMRHLVLAANAMAVNKQ